MLAAANPVFGRYDDLKSPEENIDFQSTILSRFDMIFVIQDKRDPEQDRAVTQHVLRMYQQGAVQSGRDAFQDDLFKDMATLKRYVAYARARCQPCLSPDAHTKLVNYYVGVRQQMRADGVRPVVGAFSFRLLTRPSLTFLLIPGCIGHPYHGSAAGGHHPYR